MRGLEGGGVVGHAVALGAEIALDIEHGRILGKTRRSAAIATVAAAPASRPKSQTHHGSSQRTFLYVPQGSQRDAR